MTVNKTTESLVDKVIVFFNLHNTPQLGLDKAKMGIFTFLLFAFNLSLHPLIFIVRWYFNSMLISAVKLKRLLAYQIVEKYHNI